MTTAIDLSRLQRPELPGLRLTLDAAHAEILQWLETVHGWAVAAGGADPAYRLTRLLAGREVLLRQAVSDAMAQTSLAYATGANLDHLGITYYTLARLPRERDDAYRHRLAGAFERYAVGLSGPWYESLAHGVAGVADARVTSPTPGAVTTTAADLVTAWAAVPAVVALARVALADGSDGTGVLAAVAATPLAGGIDTETVVDQITASDRVALQARTLTVEVT